MNSLCLFSRIKVAPCQTSLKSVQRFSCANVRDRQMDLFTIEFIIWIMYGLGSSLIKKNFNLKLFWLSLYFIYINYQIHTNNIPVVEAVSKDTLSANILPIYFHSCSRQHAYCRNPVLQKLIILILLLWSKSNGRKDTCLLY